MATLISKYAIKQLVHLKGGPINGVIIEIRFLADSQPRYIVGYWSDGYYQTVDLAMWQLDAYEEPINKSEYRRDYTAKQLTPKPGENTVRIPTGPPDDPDRDSMEVKVERDEQHIIDIMSKPNSELKRRDLENDGH